MTETIEERILKVGAKLIDEMLLHDIAIESNIIKNSFGDVIVYTDVHPIAMFREDELKELGYLSRRINLSEDGKTQFDEFRALELETKRVVKINKIIDDIMAGEMNVEGASEKLGMSERQISKLVKWNRKLKEND